MLHSLTSLKKLSLALGVAGIGALIGLPALAQSSPSGGTSEFKLSKEGYVILCDRTPMNSRCAGSPYSNSSSSPSRSTNPADSRSGTTAPTQNLPSETDETTSPTSPASGANPRSGGLLENGSGSSGMGTPSRTGTVGTPSNTTAPTENLPSESDKPSSQNRTPSGTMNGGMMHPGSSSGSSGSMGSPSNTTAPTENLPSETQGK